MSSERDVNQFVRPHGFLGRLAGRLMAVVNADMERAAIDALPLGDGAAVLEIGFGPGVGIRRLTRRFPAGFVAGIDPSPVMVAHATARNHGAVGRGRVDLRLGTASRLPWDDGRFDGICSVNNIHLWQSLAADLGEVRRTSKPQGWLSIAVHAWADRHAIDRGDSNRPWRDHVVAALEATGYRVTASREARARSGGALYFLAQRR